ncbi:hypothetical protein [Mesorhizobium sp. A623]
MNAKQIRQSQRAALNCAKAGIPYDLAVWLVADWLKKHDIRVTTRNLESAFAGFIE